MYSLFPKKFVKNIEQLIINLKF